MSGRLAGKVAIITGSTEGIGFGIAKRLAEDGAAIVISSRKQKNVDEALGKLKDMGHSVTGQVCHVANDKDRKSIVELALKQTGKIDILVSNAGINPTMCHVLDTPEDAWDKIFDVNVKAGFLLSKEVLPHMEKQNEGVIIYVSSFVGIQPVSVLGAYSVSKTALLGLTKAAASQCAPYNIRVNSLCPGLIKTKFSERLSEDPNLVDIPLKRLGTPEDCGNMVAFLCSHEASYITGENFLVAGGIQSRL